MPAFAVVETKVGANVRSGFGNVLVRFQIDFLVLERSPQSFGENVVKAAASSIHGYINAVFLQNFDKFLVRKLTALVGV